MIQVLTPHPCLSCGACCAFYRVSFHWTETAAESHGVPIALTTQISQYVNAMDGTNQTQPSCVALKGIVGVATSCSIYEKRPNCCRIFKASFEDGAKNENCDEARLSKGLKVLSLTDWVKS
jgi:Fe-S-cluster containining protein